MVPVVRLLLGVAFRYGAQSHSPCRVSVWCPESVRFRYGARSVWGWCPESLVRFRYGARTPWVLGMVPVGFGMVPVAGLGWAPRELEAGVSRCTVRLVLEHRSPALRLVGKNINGGGTTKVFSCLFWYIEPNSG